MSLTLPRDKQDVVNHADATVHFARCHVLVTLCQYHVHHALTFDWRSPLARCRPPLPRG